MSNYDLQITTSTKYIKTTPTVNYFSFCPCIAICTRRVLHWTSLFPFKIYESPKQISLAFSKIRVLIFLSIEQKIHLDS